MSADGPRPTDLAEAEQGRLAARSLDDVSPVLEAERRRVEEEVFAVLQDPKQVLTGEQAVQAWLRIFESRRLEKRLRSRIRKGERAAERTAN